MKNPLRKYFFTGLLFILPLFISGYLLFVLFRFIDGILGSLINIYFQKTFGLYIPGLGVILFFVIIILVGFLSTHFLGKGFHRLLDRIIRVFPLLRHIYPSVKKAFEFLFSRDEIDSRKVVMFEYPQPGNWSIGFVTNETFTEARDKSTQDLLSVFVPMAPNPTTGFLVFVPRKNVFFMDITTKDAMRMIVSGGLLNPTQ